MEIWLIGKIMSEPFDFSNTHVLVIDDEEFMREMIRRLLGMVGIGKISEATDGADGLTRIAAEPPDLVLLDIMMEPMNGLKFLKAIRIGMGGVRNDQPVIVLTGSNEQSVFGTAMALDCNAFIQKAENLNMLKDRMARVLRETFEVQSSSAYQSVSVPDITITVPRPKRKPVTAPPPLSAAYEVAIEEVEAGAMVARDMITEEGSVLLVAGTTLSTAYLNRLKDISEIIQLPSIWVKR
jgi:two-component system chemotaxis response regulator CheY